MENEVNVKGVSLKELFINCIWKSDSYKTVSKESPKKSPKVVSAKVSKVVREEETETDKEWKKVLERIDKQEMSVRNGGQVLSKNEGRKTSRTESLKGMQVNTSSKGREQSIRQKEENIDREREE